MFNVNIFSKELLLNQKINNKDIGWEEVTNSYFMDDFKKLEYIPNYEGYFLYTYEDKLYFSKDLITWQRDTINRYIRDEINKYIYKVSTKTQNNCFEVYISKMTSWNNFEPEILIDSFENNLYTGFSFNGSARFGNCHLFSFSVWTQKQSDNTYLFDSYQKIAYTSNFAEWNTQTIYSKIDLNAPRYDQQTSLGCIDSKYVLLSHTEEGFCPVIFTSPENYVYGAPVWSSGNMTGACGFYLNNALYYYDMRQTRYKSEDGINFSPVSNIWLNPSTLFYNSSYITCDAVNFLLRVYDENFSTYTQINTPCEYVKNILGILGNKLYILGTNQFIYRTNIDNILI
nr:MAG TPA: hypothetical protein [Caudoviricetes sp.]